ncbi:F-box protein CPR1 [Daucus carota subsp. sativus]|uniref:F-box protein CPR1 n=1 Tax=Daucus carota subsp. sativus TaxID=79200 RepID=UPI0007EF8A51|nr:PREDICTED: F-box protein CPR30-like [Daucus carota subsp. sativus]
MSSIPPKSFSIAASAPTPGKGCLDGTFYFPEQLIPEILLHLPVKHLLRIRCVCKPWCSLIDSPSFVKRHLQRNIETNPDSHIILRSCSSGSNFFMADVHSLCNSPAVEIDDPVKTYLSGAEFLGSCNGIVCLLKNNTDILLWNPATRKLRELPKPTSFTLPSSFMGFSIFGFGYDHLNDDYKVVKIFDYQIWGMLVTVYSLKNDSWRQAEAIPKDISITTKRGMYANGSLYWVATKDSPVIFAFDLGVERHRELPYPTYNNENDQTAGMGMIIFDRCLRIIDHYSGYRTDLWLMNDNGVGNSWSMVLSLEQRDTQGPYTIVWHNEFSKTRNDLFITVDEDRLVWYDHKKNEVKNVTIRGVPPPSQMLVYTESLVQLGSDPNFNRMKLLKQSDKKKYKGKQLKNDQMSSYLAKGFKLKL